MIALDKDPTTNRKHTGTNCRSRLRRPHAHDLSFGRRPGRSKHWSEESSAPNSPVYRLSDADNNKAQASPAPTKPVALELYLREVGQVRALTPAAEKALAAKAQRGDQHAREELLKSNLHLVVSIAQEFEGLGLPLLDLVAEGNLGLLEALSHFDPDNDSPLSSLATVRIRQTIKRALATHARPGRQP